MTRLSRSTPAPDPQVVHLGLGAFFRGHGAVYFDDLARSGHSDWGVVGVSLKSAGTRDTLAGQDTVYTVVEADQHGVQHRIIEILSGVLVAPEAPDKVLNALEACRLVTLTITEKGYCHHPATGRLNVDHPDIQADLAQPSQPQSALGYLVCALNRRRLSERPPFTILSCDNLPENGKLLRGLIIELAERMEPDLAAWIAKEGAFPCSMVDRIVPAAKPNQVDKVQALCGYEDQAAILCEPFRQWVIEDNFMAGTRPPLDLVGADFTADVRPFEHMKLRMLNGTHSALAYLGYLAGYETISDAVADPALGAFVKYLWRSEIIPVLDPPEGLDLIAYADALFRRYQNPELAHRTQQIAMDGSQKIPQRLLSSLVEHLQTGQMPKGICLVLAAWMIYTSGRGLDGQRIEVQDPLADRLAAFWHQEDVVGAYLSESRIFPSQLAGHKELQDALVASVTRLKERGVVRVISEI